MYWPRFRLTKEESQRWAVYSSPDAKQKGVLYRTYAGEIALSTTNREDSEPIQISRRARVMAFTASGDVHNIEIKITDSAGEQYTMGWVPVSNMLLGAAPDFRSMIIPGGNPIYSLGGSAGFILGFIPGVMGGADTVAPHIFEPNIVLDPNQTITIQGRSMHQLVQGSVASDPEIPVYAQTATLSFNLHVVEFPLE